ncbi:ABC transporter permease [Xanthobacter sp. KR7-65]|uniref:ABC transporter permease n=1 Tax=Xanthobacter sp. KR7-65 TaxID=3156612 RepID=UPI0032B39AEE
MIGGGAVLLFLLGWWISAQTLDPMRVPQPADVWDAAVQLATTGYAGGTLMEHTLHSIRLAFLGFAVAAGSALPIGLAMGMSRSAEAVFGPIVAFIRPIPPLAWIPLAIIWFGLGDGAKIFVIWFTAFVPSLINTFTGVRNVDPNIIAAARVHGAGTRRLLLDVIIPGAAPMIFSGLRVSLQASWMALVAAELIGAFFGLGRVLMTAAQDIFPGMIVVAMAMVALCGATMTWLLGVIERRCLPWLKVTP